MNDSVTTPYYASPKKHVSQKRKKNSSNVKMIQAITVRFHLALFITKHTSSFPTSFFPAQSHFALLCKKNPSGMNACNSSPPQTKAKEPIP